MQSGTRQKNYIETATSRRSPVGRLALVSSENEPHVLHAVSGHLYDATRNTPDGVELMTLDDRRPEPMEVQLAAELRRVAAKYTALAERIENNTAPAAAD